MRLILPLLIALSLPPVSQADTAQDTFLAAKRAYDARHYGIAFPLMSVAATANLPQAQYWLANMYQQGHGVEKSVETAAQWMLRAAENGHPDAIPNLTARYETGNGGLPKDIPRALEWAQKGADMGVILSMQDLARYHRQGRGTPVDLAQTVYWEQKAAQAGDKNSQYNMGYYYDAGYGPIQPDGAQALHWYSLAMAQGQVMAAENLGKMHYHGNGIPQDHAAALSVWKQAAQMGSKTSAYNVGLMLHSGQGTAPDTAAALHWLQQSASLDYVPALMLLGDIHFNGRGLPADLPTGAAYYERAALRFDPRALYILGQLFYYGEVKPQDDIRAWVWLAYAAGNGYQNARPLLDTLRARMSEQDQTAANSLADRCYSAQDYAPCL